MESFIHQDFLLHSQTAVNLYHNHAGQLPIIDYHCHLNPREVAENRPFASITRLWLGGDHYKWRAMRANGISEELCTGSEAGDWEKFRAWADTVPYLMRNPLYHWTHLELKRAFGIDKVLSPKTAREIYDECNEKLKLPEYTPQGLMRRFAVEAVCTTDDPADSLACHKQIAESGFTVKVLPTWRPDKAAAVEQAAPYRTYIENLSQVSGVTISCFNDLLDALRVRHNFFASCGCKLSDHGLGGFYAEDYTRKEVEQIFNKVYGGSELTENEIAKFKSAMLHEGALMDAESSWTQQFHYGAQRNNNSLMFRKLGADTGFDSIGEYNVAQTLAKFLDRLNSEGKLAKTIVYNLNPNANVMLAAMMANYQDGITAGKMQFGAAWWFCDHKEGMQQQMNALSSQGLLSRFVGMLTDSRSFLSYPRHEYFRRILCDLLGEDVENGEIPREEIERVEEMVGDICYLNAKRYFDF